MNPNLPVIGIAGKARSGKDTTAEFIAARLPIERYALADPIRGMLHAIGINMNDDYWKERKEEVIPALGKSPRMMMQTLGTEWGRKLVNPHIWVMMAHQRLMNAKQTLVITDVRFNNEADWVRSMNGVIIHVDNPRIDPVSGHSSEKGVERKENDIVLLNDGTLEDLQLKVREICHGLTEARDSLHIPTPQVTQRPPA
jgi:dephospho-CoA kinase